MEANPKAWAFIILVIGVLLLVPKTPVCGDNVCHAGTSFLQDTIAYLKGE